jgi:hypothetical protein
MARLEVVKNVTGQRIYFKPPQGTPSATPSVSIKDKGGATVTAANTTYVTLDSVSTTVSTANSVNDNYITLASVSNIEWRETYLLTNSLLQKEWVRVKSVNSSSKVVYFDEPLKFVHDTSATFKGVRFYYTLQASEVDTHDELFTARASYAVNSLNYIMEIPFDVVITPLQNPLTVEFVKRRHPDIMAYEPTETRGTDFADLRDQAWSEVLMGIREQNTPSGSAMRPALLRTPEDLDEWAVAEFDLLAQKNGIMILRGWDPKEATTYLEEQKNKRKNKSLSNLHWYDEDESSSLGQNEESPISMDYIR